MLPDPKRVETIFHAALANSDPAVRSAFLAEAAGEDSELRRRVERLLEAHAELGEILGPRGLTGHTGNNSPLNPLRADPSTAGIPAEELGDRVGQYRLLQKLGEGGMGAVWVAEQEQPVRRRVALKLIKPGMDSARVIARFEAERQALALMDHTNIAKILDAGTAPSGRPYFVMELVKGVPITRYCDELHLGIRERLELFVQVCAAIQHAHQKGVIHRDLKPSNVLVAVQDGKPIPKVIDFGVAKALFARLADRTMYTEIGAVIGTLEYMAPEQAELSALDVDSRADVYTLGVLLYELITGSTPLTGERVKSVALGEALRLIREEEPPLPSARLSTTVTLSTIAAARRVESTRLGPMVRGELDWIVMRALEKDRTRRYESASSLARDVERHLMDEPVEACPPSTWYRLRKLARKNRGPAVAAGLVVVALIGGVIGTTLAMIEARRQEWRALSEADDSKKARVEVEEQRKTAVDQKERAGLHLYVARIQAAQQAWRDGNVGRGNVGRVRELLEETRPGPGDVDLRGFEWHYLRRLADDEPTTLHPCTTVRKVAFSPDGRFLFASGVGGHRNETGEWMSMGYLTLWDATTRRVVRSFPMHARAAGAVAFGARGKLLAWAHEAEQRAVEVWDVDTDRRAIILPAVSRSEAQHVHCLAFSPDGKRLAVGYGNVDKEAPAKVWDVATGKVLLTIPGLHSHFRSLAFSPDGERLVGGSHDGSVKVWDAATGRETLVLKGLGHSVLDVAFSPDGTRLASTVGHIVRLWNAKTGEELLSLWGHVAGVSSVAFSPDGRRVATGGFDRTVRMWDLATGREAFTLKGHLDSVWSVAFSPDGKWLACGTHDRAVKLFDATRDPETLVLDWAVSVAFGPDGRRVAIAGKDDTIRIRNMAGGPDILRLAAGTLADSLPMTFSPDGRRLAAVHGGSASGRGVKVWDTTTGELIRSLDDPGFLANRIAFSADNRFLAATGRGKKQGVQVWDTTTGQLVNTLPMPAAIAISPAGDQVVAHSDRHAALWELATRQQVQSVEIGDGHLGEAAISPDGRWLATAIWSAPRPREIAVWDLQTGRQVFALRGLTELELVTCMAFSPDSQRLVAGTGGFSVAEKPTLVRMWELRTGQIVLELPAGYRTVRAAAFSPDGNCLACAGDAVRIWDATPRKSGSNRKAQK